MESSAGNGLTVRYNSVREITSLKPVDKNPISGQLVVRVRQYVDVYCVVRQDIYKTF